MQLGDVATWVGVVIALGSAVWAAVGAGKARKAQREASQSATRAAVAAERSAQAAERSAAAQEALAEQATRYEPPWALRRVSQYEYALVNDGPEDALEVSLGFEKGFAVIAGEVRHDRVSARASVRFSGLRTSGGSGPGRHVTVTWTRPNGEHPDPWTETLPR